MPEKTTNKNIDFKIDQNQIAWVTFDLQGEKVNKLSRVVLTELREILTGLQGNKTLKGLIFISAKDSIFIAGADIKEIENIKSAYEGEQAAKEGQSVFDLIASLKFPTLAAIHGACLGGGCELALACTYRMATDDPKTKIGLPEIQLGILPGFGGTQRMPRLIGLQKSLSIILPGKSVDGKKSFKLGLVDALVPKAWLKDKAQEFILGLNKKKIKKIKQKRKVQGLPNILLEKTFIGNQIIFSQAKKTVMSQTKGLYPAPLKALEVIQKTQHLSLKHGLEIEAKALGDLAQTGVCKNLIHVYYLNEEAKKATGVMGVDKFDAASISDLSEIAVIGAGVMGGGIAQLFASQNYGVRLKDISWELVAKGFEAAAKIFKGSVKRKRLSQREADLKLGHITGTIDYTGFKAAGLVVEAVVENMDIKKKVLKETETFIGPDAILASNTSSLSITEMAKAVNRPQRVIGMHFFNPVDRMPLVEVIRGEQTDDATVMKTVELSKKIGKTPIVCKDKEGFIVNRILLPYLNEAAGLLMEGHHMLEIDRYMTKFGMPMGPVTLADEVGIDVGFKVAQILEKTYGARMKVNEILQQVYEKKWLGKKVGKGFYVHDDKKKTRKPNPELNELLANKKPTTDRRDVLDRMVLLMINEAAMILEEGVAMRAEDIDIGMIFGTGFPPFRGGLLKYADDLGVTNIIKRLEELSLKYGNRFLPAKILIKYSQENKKFIN